MDRSRDLLHDFKRRVVPVRLRVVRIGKLLRNEYPRILRFHLQGPVQAFGDAFSDIPVVMNKDHFGPVMLYELPALLADGIRHDDDRPVAPYRADQSQADSLISARRLHDNRVLMDESLFFRLLYHVPGSPRLDRTSYVEAFKFDKYLRVSGFVHSVQTYDGRVSERIQYRVTDHSCVFSFIFPPR